MNWENLNLPVGPWVTLAIGKPDEVRQKIAIQAKVLVSPRVVEIQGNSARTLSSLYQIIEMAFSLPGYFGRNLNALKDCLTDGDIMGQQPTMIFVSGADEFLCDENDDALAGVLDTLSLVGELWSEPGPWPWNWKPTPFHSVLGFEHDDKVGRYGELERLQ